MANRFDAPSTRASLLEQIRDPDCSETWDAVFDIYKPCIHRYCVQSGLQDADADDVTQTVLLAIRTFDYHPERGKFRGWLHTVINNEINRCRKKAKFQPAANNLVDEVPGSDNEVLWTEVFNSHVLSTALERIRSEFDRITWQAFCAVSLVFYQTDTGERVTWNDSPGTNLAKTVAGRINKSVGWVYQAKSKVLKRLKEEILYLAEDMPELGG